MMRAKLESDIFKIETKIIKKIENFRVRGDMWKKQFNRE
jgi:hypothetical protein